VALPDRADNIERLRATLATIAPGTSLRDGLERILRGRTGALIVLGQDRNVDAISTGGFTLDVPFTATALRELAKMDGAIVLDSEVSRVHRANVHLMPDHTIPSDETGTRHRTADRVAKQTGHPVISVSQSMQIIAVYVGDIRYVLEDSGQILSRANQALATLERYKLRLDEVSSTLSALEIEDLVTVRDVAVVAQRLEMVTRIAREIDGYVLELGTDGRLLALQLEELFTGVDAERELVVRDYQHRGGRAKQRTPAEILDELESLSPTDLVDVGQVAHALGLGGGEHLDAAVSPAGYRLLAKVPRLPDTVIDRLVEHFDTLQKLLSATVEDLQLVEGVGELRARSVREGLSRLAESSILERYV
jgi:diadenylate cyclase